MKLSEEIQAIIDRARQRGDLCSEAEAFLHGAVLVARLDEDRAEAGFISPRQLAEIIQAANRGAAILSRESGVPIPDVTVSPEAGPQATAADK